MTIVKNENGLSDRQIEIIAKLAEGKPAKVVANEMKISLASVNNDVGSSIKKLSAGNTAGLVATAFRHGWIA